MAMVTIVGVAMNVSYSCEKNLQTNEDWRGTIFITNIVTLLSMNCITTDTPYTVVNNRH